MPDLYTHAFADNIRLAKSKILIAPANGTWNLIRVPRLAFVRQVWLWISTAYAGGAPVVTVGFIGNGETADVDGFMTNFESDPGITGLKTSLGGSAVWADGKYFNSAEGAITLTTTKGTTAGTMIVFADYTVVF